MKWLYRIFAVFMWLLVAFVIAWADYANRYHNTPQNFRPSVRTFLIRYINPDYRRKAKRPASRGSLPKSERRTKTPPAKRPPRGESSK